MKPEDFQFTQKMAATADQANKWLADNLPALWWGLFVGMKEKGFTESQALMILMQYIAKPSS